MYSLNIVFTKQYRFHFPSIEALLDTAHYETLSSIQFTTSAFILFFIPVEQSPVEYTLSVYLEKLVV